MKRKFIAVLYGLISFFILGLITYPVLLFVGNGFVLGTSLLISSMVTGYFAREKGWLYGILMGLSPYLLIIFGFFLFALYLLWITNFNLGSDLSSFLNYEFWSYNTNIFIRVVLVSLIGGYMGEHLYRRRNLA